VRCCALRVLGIRHHAHQLHDFTPSWLAAEVCPMQGKFKTQAAEQFLCRRGPSGSWSPAPQDCLERGQGVDLSTAGFCFRSSTSSAAGLNPSSFRRAFRMRRVGSNSNSIMQSQPCGTKASAAGVSSHIGRSGKFCERKSVRCGSWSPAPQDGLERGQGVELIHRGVLLQADHQQRHRAEPVQLPPRVLNAPRGSK